MIRWNGDFSAAFAEKSPPKGIKLAAYPFHRCRPQSRLRDQRQASTAHLGLGWVRDIRDIRDRASGRRVQSRLNDANGLLAALYTALYTAWSSLAAWRNHVPSGINSAASASHCARPARSLAS